MSEALEALIFGFIGFVLGGGIGYFRALTRIAKADQTAKTALDQSTADHVEDVAREKAQSVYMTAPERMKATWDRRDLAREMNDPHYRCTRCDRETPIVYCEKGPCPMEPIATPQSITPPS